MTLKKLINGWFVNNESIASKMAKYCGQPAIFHKIIPDDKQQGWNGNQQYPRICYTYDMQVNKERSSVGMLNVALYCDRSSTIIYDLEDEIKRCLKDVLMKPDNEAPYCFTWARTDGFEFDSAGAVVQGVDIRFDILEYPSQETTDPDPIMAMLVFIKGQYPDTVVIGLDTLEEYTVASEKPVFYCRVENMEKGLETNTVVWMDCKIGIHVIYPDAQIRQKMIAGLTNKLSLDGQVKMLDGSPMRMKRLVANNKADYLTEGQIMAVCHYGLLRYKSKGIELHGVENENIGG